MKLPNANYLLSVGVFLMAGVAGTAYADPRPPDSGTSAVQQVQKDQIRQAVHPETRPLKEAQGERQGVSNNRQLQRNDKVNSKLTH